MTCATSARTAPGSLTARASASVLRARGGSTADADLAHCRDHCATPRFHAADAPAAPSERVPGGWPLLGFPAPSARLRASTAKGPPGAVSLRVSREVGSTDGCAIEGAAARDPPEPGHGTVVKQACGGQAPVACIGTHVSLPAQNHERSALEPLVVSRGGESPRGVGGCPEPANRRVGDRHERQSESAEAYCSFGLRATAWYASAASWECGSRRCRPAVLLGLERGQ